MLETPFGVFCEGLGSNSHLQLLDVRNNQITHTGAQELAAALKRNTSLRALGKNIFGVRFIWYYYESFWKIEISGSHEQDYFNSYSDYLTITMSTKLWNTNAIREKRCIISMLVFTDLRWNNLGLLGARALLGALSSNKNIIKLELAGNNVPNDVLRSLGKCSLPTISVRIT